MTRDNLFAEERNDEWGPGCCIDGGHCIECGNCYDDDGAHSLDASEIARLTKEGHTEHCAARQVWGDGECECKLQGIIPGNVSRLIIDTLNPS